MTADIMAFGISHKYASVDLRGQVSFAPESVIETLQGALVELDLSEIALLSTCNRTEIYAVGDVSDQQWLDWLTGKKGSRSR